MTSLSDLPIESLNKYLAFINSLTCSELIDLFEEGSKLLSEFGTYHEVEELSGAVFVGDTHGDVETVHTLLSSIGFDKLGKEYNVIFLGDYVDRGPNQIETLLLPLALKARWPERVAVLRGNHEPPPSLPVYPNDFGFVIRRVCNGTREAFEAVQRLFDSMQLFASYEGYVAFHGGPPLRRLKYCKGRLCFSEVDEVVLEDVLWSDPDELVSENLCSWEDPLESCVVKNSMRGAGLIWGSGATREFLERTGFEKIVRGHTSVNGFDACHKEKVYTLFTRMGSPYFNTRASVLLVENGKERLVELEEG